MESTRDEMFAYVVAYSNSDCTVNIDGTRYVYRGSMSGIKLKETFESIAKYSQGKAVNWIKENATVIDKY